MLSHLQLELPSSSLSSSSSPATAALQTSYHLIPIVTIIVQVVHPPASEFQWWKLLSARSFARCLCFTLTPSRVSTSVFVCFEHYSHTHLLVDAQWRTSALLHIINLLAFKAERERERGGLTSRLQYISWHKPSLPLVVSPFSSKLTIILSQ